MSHPLFPLISLANLVKIGRYSKEMEALPVAQIPHCFHSCLAGGTLLRVRGVGGGGVRGAINSCVKTRNEKQKG